MGHVMNYTIGDVIVRTLIMQGHNVLSPIGWDSFGLPAENAAIREGTHPSENIEINIKRMRQQMKQAGWGFDWSREIATSHEDYYKWTQWLFLQFYKAGLAQKKKAPVNWCPNDQTVLANEQVHDGKCERCGTPVQQRDLEQWFLLMSTYAQRLLEGHSHLKEWPDRVLKMQKEWIGRSEGALVHFDLEHSDARLDVFTTRPDTLFGVTFLSIAPQHPLIDTLIAEHPEKEMLIDRINAMRSLGTSEIDIMSREKEGIFTGKYAINPVNGDRVPIYIANFVVMSYGTGVVMAVPAHDQRDFEFARKYSIPVKVVITPPDGSLDPQQMKNAYVDDGVMVDSGIFSGTNNRAAMPQLIEWLEEKRYGEKTVTYRLRDWLISRQRYWGAPIPIIYCPKCGMVPVPEDQLPVRLPENVAFKPVGESPLKECESFIQTKCPQCNEPAMRDPDTMDTFVDSSWYYLRYTSPHQSKHPFDKGSVDYWCPVDIYIGGIEHATMHLIYVRFFAEVMQDLGLLAFDEPVKKLFCQGMVCKTAYYCPEHKWLKEEDVHEDSTCALCGNPVTSEVTKMSKTKLNVVSPERIIETYGADTMRMYTLADNPPDRDQVWSEEGVQGVSRFLNRLWDTYIDLLQKLDGKESDPQNKTDDDTLRFATHTAIIRWRQAVEANWQFNTAIARIMELLNTIRKHSGSVSQPVLKEACETLLLLLAPIAPHITEELWRQLGNTESIFRTRLPEADQSALTPKEVTIVVQVNGKVRAQFTTSPEVSKEQMQKMAFEDKKIQGYIEGKTVRKVITVPGKLVNIVVG